MFHVKHSAAPHGLTIARAVRPTRVRRRKGRPIRPLSRARISHGARGSPAHVQRCAVRGGHPARLLLRAAPAPGQGPASPQRRASFAPSRLAFAGRRVQRRPRVPPRVRPDTWKTPFLVLLVLSAVGAVVHNVVPVGPAVAGILAYPFGVLAGDFGISMYCMLMVVAWQASLAYVLPLDCVPILTYSTGYYRMGDMARIGWVPTVALVALTATLLPALCALLGFA